MSCILSDLNPKRGICIALGMLDQCLNTLISGQKAILVRFFDWLGRKRYIDLPEWHLGKGVDK